MDAPLTERQLLIVALVAEGLTRWAIAARLDLSETTVREHIRVMCERFDCSMRNLPAAVGIVVEDDDGEPFTFRERRTA